jgi:AcrR family transcriptional regulator
MNTRQQIIDAAVLVIGTKGLVGATTREIARAANCAEGTLYTHFPNKEALFLAALTASLPTFVEILEKQLARVGEGELATNLEQIAHAAIAYYRQNIPLASVFFADPGLLERYRATLRELDTGPHRTIARVTAYIQAEQRFGRVSREADAQTTALLLIGPCFQYIYMQSFLGYSPLSLNERTFVADLVATALQGILPEHHHQTHSSE